MLDEHFERVRTELDARRIGFRELSDGVEIQIGRDFGLALVLAQVVFQDVMGLSLARDCVGYMRDVLVSNHPGLTGADASNEEVFFH
jgi:hypothetical protein